MDAAGCAIRSSLFVSAVLFALVHSLNSVNDFRGQFMFTWSFALLDFFFVVVRERTGRIWAGMGIHALSNILGYAAALAAGAV